MSSANFPPEIKEKVISVLGWPTDVVSVDYCSRDSPSNTSDWPQPDSPRTVLIFLPGNPGCIGWYTPNLVELVTRLGRGFAARGISYAGHGTNEEITDVQRWVHSKERDTNIPWTVNGQIRHKVAYMDMLISEFQKHQGDDQDQNQNVLPQFIFLSHSIGSHMVQRLLVLRPDILERTVMNVQLMPFTRMNAPRLKQTLLDLGASSPGTLIGVTQRILQVLKFMPYEWVDCLMKSALDDEAGRTLAVKLVRQPLFARNFFELGTEEIRDVPQEVDACALRTIGKQCPTAMLYCGKDQWAPEFHQEDLRELQQKNVIPQNIWISYMPNVRHDYVSYDHMVREVVDWCFESIEAGLKLGEKPRPRL